MSFPGSFDTYTLRARYLPCLLVLLPMLLALVTWIPNAKSVFGGILALLGLCGVGYLLGEIGGDAGKRKEPGLWASWGGAPTTRLLRHDRSGNPVLVEHIHRRLEALSGLSFPTKQQEASDRKKADAIYASAVTVLRDMTRNRAMFPLVFRESVAYGFRRNLWGMKALGLSLTTAGLIACGARAWMSRPAVNLQALGSMTICTILILTWSFIITPEWIRLRADAYAERLIESCERLKPAAPAKTTDGASDM